MMSDNFLLVDNLYDCVYNYNRQSGTNVFCLKRLLDMLVFPLQKKRIIIEVLCGYVCVEEAVFH